LAAISRTALPILAEVVGWLAIAVIGVATALLAWAVRPALSGRTGLMRYTGATVDEVIDAVNAKAGDRGRRAVEQAEELVALSRLARVKYERIRLAVDLLLVSLGGVAVTVVIALLG